MTTCPSAWTPAPADAAAPFSSACYKASGYAISLRECVERCALDGAAPVCPASTAENNFVSSVAVFKGINYMWLGVYRNASGVDRCVTGVDSDYTAFAVQFGQPDNVYGLEHCTYQYSSNDGSWYDGTCDWGTTRYRFGCMCSGPANVSASYLADVAYLEAPAESYITALRGTASLAFGIGWRRRSTGCRRRSTG